VHEKNLPAKARFTDQWKRRGRRRDVVHRRKTGGGVRNTLTRMLTPHQGAEQGSEGDIKTGIGHKKKKGKKKMRTGEKGKKSTERLAGKLRQTKTYARTKKTPGKPIGKNY